MNNDKDLLALKALAEAATPGPWESEHHRVFDSNGGSVAEFASTRGMYEPEHANRDYIAAANPVAILSLISRIEQQAARIAELEGVAHLWKRDRANPTPAVDLSGLTRYELETAVDTGAGLYPSEDGEYVRFDDLQKLLSAPVVREGKMTNERIEALVPWEGDPKDPYFDRIKFARAIEREVLATGKQVSEPVAWIAPSDSLPESGKLVWVHRKWVYEGKICQEVRMSRRFGNQPLVVDRHPSECTYWGDNDVGTYSDVTVVGWAEIAPPAVPVATPSTPSQEWNGELPEPDVIAYTNIGDNDAYSAEAVRKAIGAAVAGVRDAALEEAARQCEARAERYDHGDSAAIHSIACAEAIRSLSSNPVSLREKARADDFAKIVRATSGQQVLFFKEVCEEGNTLHCVANFEDFQSDLAMAGLPDDAFATALDKVDVKMADQVLAQVADLGFGDTASNGNGEGGAA